MRNIVWTRVPNDFATERTTDSVENLSVNWLIPSVLDAVDERDELVVLLKIAAEVEHALFIQYLYAAYSIPDDTNSTKIALLLIAKQEMGHFLAVQNLLLSIGGISAIHLHKNQFRPQDSENNPLPFTLEPISKKLMAKFVSVEAPPVPPPELEQKVKEIRKLANEAAGVDLNPVGGLYTKIFWLFQPNDSPVFDLIPLSPDSAQGREPGQHIKETDFLPLAEIQKFEAFKPAWETQSSFGANELKLNSVYDYRSALEIVYQIAVQGEGADFDDEIKSHFELFLTAFDDFDQSLTELKSLPVNPVTVANTEFHTSTLIENNYSRLWCLILNSVYTSLLLDIYSTMFYRQHAKISKEGFIRLVFISMRSIVGPLSRAIIYLPLLDNGFEFDSEPRCGPTYEIDPEFRLSTDKTEVDALNHFFIDKIRALTELIESHTDFEAHLDADEDSGDLTNPQGLIEQIRNYCSLKNQLIDSLNQ